MKKQVTPKIIIDINMPIAECISPLTLAKSMNETNETSAMIASNTIIRLHLLRYHHP